MVLAQALYRHVLLYLGRLDYVDFVVGSRASRVTSLASTLHTPDLLSTAPNSNIVIWRGVRGHLWWKRHFVRISLVRTLSETHRLSSKQLNTLEVTNRGETTYCVAENYVARTDGGLWVPSGDEVCKPADDRLVSDYASIVSFVAGF